MMRCPFCKKAAHVRTSRYLSDNVKQSYHQCVDVFCSATFRTVESIDEVIHQPAKKEVPEPAPVAPLARPLLDRARSSVRH
ncbi:MAG TPA: ogr/Delta-like zinc finger family protein [Scandinavium sp.]|jgi:transcriptional regulator NrdR family protein|uniref:ogr/Delta-like zinc finger family protein n=1 Tax=Scandinavium sp. TaxID=2830653 RepID=UPI002E34F755|nr:ogr/Delta-like zinc finger family protein [Scandinavium sp.]HEX4502972.1 ogr/Delta-like zinc finger family protein [Scandinavium sp.]